MKKRKAKNSTPKDENGQPILNQACAPKKYKYSQLYLKNKKRGENIRKLIDDVIVGLALAALGVALRAIAFPSPFPGVEVTPGMMVPFLIGFLLSGNPIVAAITGGIGGFVGPMLSGGDPVPTSLFWINGCFFRASIVKFIQPGYDPRDSKATVKAYLTMTVAYLIMDSGPFFDMAVGWIYWGLPMLAWVSYNFSMNLIVNFIPWAVVAFSILKAVERAFGAR